MIGHADTRAGLLRVERLSFTLSAGAVAASFALFTPQIATSVAAGALVEVANFRAMHASARSFFGGEFGGAGLWVGVVGLRLALLGGAMLLALALALQALWILAAIAIACSTRLGQLAPLLISFGAFLLGLSSDSLFGGPGRENSLAKLAYGITPNLQFHWLADALSLGNPASGFYLLLVSGYTILFICAILCLATALFEGKETG